MTTDRLTSAARLLVQAPPGQVTQVYHDLRGILLDPEASEDGETIIDDQIKQMAQTALQEYNTAQLIPVALEERQDQMIICQAGKLPGSNDRYVHPREAKSFRFDHMARTVSDVQPLDVDKEAEPIRAALDTAFKNYVADRYSSGVSSVFTTSTKAPASKTTPSSDEVAAEDETAKTETETEDAEVIATETEAETEGESTKPSEADPPIADPDTTEPSTATNTSEPAPTELKYTIHHVGNRFHLSNFWSGRFRASYHLTLPSASSSSVEATLTSSLQIQVHYFENGNVQLNTSVPKTFPLPSSLVGETPEKLAKTLVDIVQKYEDEYQGKVEDTCEDLGEKAFKALRRQLPLTKNKIDWNQLMNYRLGAELARN